MVGPGMFNGLNGIFNFFIGCFIAAIIGAIYGLYSLFAYYYSDIEIVSDKKLVPELRLTIKENKVDTVYVYKQER